MVLSKNMNYRRLGRTDLRVSVVGMGTCQLRLVPEEQAIATLCKAFELGVNVIHTAPDYEGADDTVAKALEKSGKDIIVCSQGHGPIDHFERLFEETCERYGKERLELFGVACVDDREALGENLWGRGGMVEFLLQKKKEGRLLGTFCTTHGAPEYVMELVKRDVFDVIMLAYNPLGFHLLSYHPKGGREFESVLQNPELFPLLQEKDVGLMIMKPLAGGLICRSQTFPALGEIRPPNRNGVRALHVLRHILRYPEVACVIPGTASPCEAQENARAGCGDLYLDRQGEKALSRWVQELRNTLCSRCGHCDDLCSKGLSVSLMFRAAYVAIYPSEIFETPAGYEYFTLHPWDELACITCRQRTCVCPSGLNIPSALSTLHRHMLRLRGSGHGAKSMISREISEAKGWDGRLTFLDAPAVLVSGTRSRIIAQVANTGRMSWSCGKPHSLFPHVGLEVELDHQSLHREGLRADIQPDSHAHFSFEFYVPQKKGEHILTLRLIERTGEDRMGRSLVLFEQPVHIKGRMRMLAVSLKRPRVASRDVFFFKPQQGHEVHMNSYEEERVEPAPRYGVIYRQHNIPSTLQADTCYYIWIEVENTGSMTWLRNAPNGHNVDLALYLDGVLKAGAILPKDVLAPGERALMNIHLQVPKSEGRHTVAFDMVEQQVTYFADQGVPRLELAIQVAPQFRSRTYDFAALAKEHCISFFWPSSGIVQGTGGNVYPAFVDQAKGCTFTDVDGREYIDYVMGWGSAWLGYGNPIIQNAIREVLDSAAIPSLPHRLEMEVTQMLCEDIPCAENVLFGKNGSDVCTAAARLARAYTGRHIILVSGYHGWQDWYIQSGGFASPEAVRAVPDTVFHYRFNDSLHLEELLSRYKGQVAAVMMEPGAAIGGLNGPIYDADRDFLVRAAELTSQEEILLIFDEIFTGFRYPGGSVQKFCGVKPDLACFGKALGGGMPLSALVGKRSVFAALSKIFYGPSFKGEVYSLAAAHACLKIHRGTDIASRVWAFGEKLRQGVNRLCLESGVPAELVGPPIRMVFSFKEQDQQRIVLMRTLVQQELLKARILTYQGFMLPSLAHDDFTLDKTLKAFSEAISVLRKAMEEDAYAKYLEIPLMT